MSINVTQLAQDDSQAAPLGSEPHSMVWWDIVLLVLLQWETTRARGILGPQECLFVLIRERGRERFCEPANVRPDSDLKVHPSNPKPMPRADSKVSARHILCLYI